MKRTKQQPTAKKTKQSSRQKPCLSSPPPKQPPSPANFNFTVTTSPPETASASARKSAAKVSPSRRFETVSSLAELKELASSRLESIKRQTERSHSDIIKDIDSSNSRLHKRIKIQTQACQKIMEETDKEFKKMLGRITESCEAMQGSYAEFQAEEQTTHSRVCKTSITEKMQFFDDAINAFRNRYVTT